MIAFVFLWNVVRKTLRDLCCMYSSSKAILKLSQSMRGHFVTLIEVSMHLITCNSGHVVYKERENEPKPSPPLPIS